MTREKALLWQVGHCALTGGLGLLWAPGPQATWQLPSAHGLWPGLVLVTSGWERGPGTPLGSSLRRLQPVHVIHPCGCARCPAGWGCCACGGSCPHYAPIPEGEDGGQPEEAGSARALPFPGGCMALVASPLESPSAVLCALPAPGPQDRELALSASRLRVRGCLSGCGGHVQPLPAHQPPPPAAAAGGGRWASASWADCVPLAVPARLEWPWCCQ